VAARRAPDPLWLRGLAFVVLGVVITGIVLGVDRVHRMSADYRAGLLGAATGIVLVGVAMVALGWRRRGGPSPGDAAVGQGG
jgi:hypothetical protein